MGRTTSACKHASADSPWARPPPAQRASGRREARRVDCCDPPLITFSKTSTRVSRVLRLHPPRGRNPEALHRRRFASRRLSEGDGRLWPGAGLVDLCRNTPPCLRHRCRLPDGSRPGKDLHPSVQPSPLPM